MFEILSSSIAECVSNIHCLFLAGDIECLFILMEAVTQKHVQRIWDSYDYIRKKTKRGQFTVAQLRIKVPFINYDLGLVGKLEGGGSSFFWLLL